MAMDPNGLPPAVRDTGWPRTPIDHFVLARLEENGLKPRPEADKATLIRRATLDRKLPATGGARHITGFVSLVEHEGRLNEALMPLKVVGDDVATLRRVMPLGIKMFLKGKVPSSLGHRIPGLSQVQAIFQRARRLLRPS